MSTSFYDIGQHMRNNPECPGVVSVWMFGGEAVLTCAHCMPADSPDEAVADANLARSISDHMRQHLEGGRLHLVLSDGNLEDGAIDWCIEHAGVNDSERAILVGLKRLSYAERWATLENGR